MKNLNSYSIEESFVTDGKNTNERQWRTLSYKGELRALSPECHTRGNRGPHDVIQKSSKFTAPPGKYFFAKRADPESNQASIFNY